MRVAHFAKYAFNRIGGVESHVGTLTRALASRGLDVTVFSYDDSRSLKATTIDGVHVEPIPAPVSFSSQSIAPSLIVRSRRLAREQPFDVVHQHWPDPFAHVAASLLPGDHAHVVTWHSDIVRQTLLRSVYFTFGPRLLALPDALIVATSAQLRASTQLAHFVTAEHQHVIPFSIDTAPFNATPTLLRTAQLLRDAHGNGPFVFALGRHVYYKGFDVLIRAMAQVPATLLLGGEGPLTPKLKQLASTINARIHFLGRISDELLPAVFHACDVFCLPSVAQTEAFGLVQAEAMASGKPIVNTSLGNGVNELAPHRVCALTVTPGNPTELADALRHLLADPDLAGKLGSVGRERIQSRYSVEKMTQQTIALYDSVCSARGTPRE